MLNHSSCCGAFARGGFSPVTDDCVTGFECSGCSNACNTNMNACCFVCPCCGQRFQGNFFGGFMPRMACPRCGSARGGCGSSRSAWGRGGCGSSRSSCGRSGNCGSSRFFDDDDSCVG